MIVDGQKSTTLIASGVQVSSVSSGFCECMTLEAHPLDRLLELEGTGGYAIPYLIYIEVNLQIAGIKGYNEDVLSLVIQTMTYSEKVLVGVRSKIIDWVEGMMTKGELMRATATLKKAKRLTLVKLCLGYSSCPTQNQRDMMKWGRRSPPPQALNLQHPGGSAWMMCGDLSHTTQKVTILPFGTISIHGSTGVWGHCMQVHMLAEPA